MDDIKAMGESGADLSYDFVTRPAYHHALVTGDTEFLRLTLNLARAMGVDPAVARARDAEPRRAHPRARALRDRAQGRRVRLRRGEQIRGERARRADPRRPHSTGSPDRRAPYNRTFTTNGIACTTATVIAATLGIRDLDRDRRPTSVETIKRVHLLLAMFNALQPGVFALSGWDLLGHAAGRSTGSRT